MKYSLSDFFTSIVYIFVIFLPGGMLLTVLYNFPGLSLSINFPFKLGETGHWLFFLSISFVLGHLISLVGASWEDWWWKAHKWKKAKDDVPDKMRAIVHSILQDSIPDSLVNNNNLRRWAVAALKNSESPSYRDIERKDADRRFFRNLRVVLIAPIILFIINIRHDEKYLFFVGINLALLYLSHLRYKDQDKKFTKAVFESLIVSHPLKEYHDSSTKNKEIEKRFLVVGDSWRGRGSGVDIRQGYLSTDEERIVRIRVEGESSWITIKGKSVGAAQQEYEYPIPLADANKMLSSMCKDYIIEKTRYTINVSEYCWVIDEFKGLNNGLVIAEIESKDEKDLENALKSKPPWLGDDITLRYEFRNSNLSQHPYSHWNKQVHS